MDILYLPRRKGSRFGTLLLRLMQLCLSKKTDIRTPQTRLRSCGYLSLSLHPFQTVPFSFLRAAAK